MEPQQGVFVAQALCLAQGIRNSRLKDWEEQLSVEFVTDFYSLS